MSVSYNKLWKFLIDKGMKKTDLQVAAGQDSLLSGLRSRRKPQPPGKSLYYDLSR